jgi:hypothetical protein
MLRPLHLQPTQRAAVRPPVVNQAASNRAAVNRAAVNHAFNDVVNKAADDHAVDDHAADDHAADDHAADDHAADDHAADGWAALRGGALEEPAAGGLVAADGFMPGLMVGEQIGIGRRCMVYAARCEGAEVVVKRYRPDAIVKHAELADMPLAEFEFRRNQACYAVPGLDRNVARPYGYYVDAGAQWIVQERLYGQLCSDSSADWSEPQWRALRNRLLELVSLAHRAGLYDLDLHPGNVMLSPAAGEAEPVLFDFNLVPFTERRRRTLDGWLYRLGLVDASYRDLRRLRKRFR